MMTNGFGMKKLSTIETSKRKVITTRRRHHESTERQLKVNDDIMDDELDRMNITNQDTDFFSQPRMMEKN